MTKNNGIPIEVKKPTETVQYVENKIPSYEKFMKNYENDGKVNYDDLSGGDVGEVKGYGPCSGCSNGLTFKLDIVLKNSRGGWKKMTVYDVNDAREEASKISRKVDFWRDNIEFSTQERSSLVDKINNAINEHINNYENINRVVENDIDDGPCIQC